jgi:hypothetical protein
VQPDAQQTAQVVDFRRAGRRQLPRHPRQAFGAAQRVAIAPGPQRLLVRAKSPAQAGQRVDLALRPLTTATLHRHQVVAVDGRRAGHQ